MCNPKGMNQSRHDYYVASTHTSLGEHLGMEVLEAHEDRTVIRMRVEGNTQVAGVLHGGATAALCETAASTAAFIHAHKLAGEADPEEHWEVPADAGQKRLTAVGTELTVSHLRPARSGHVTATATAVHLGRRTTVHTLRVRDDEGKDVAIGLATNMIVEA